MTPEMAPGDAQKAPDSKEAWQRLEEEIATLRVSEERFRAMFEQASVGIVQVTLSGRMHLPNPGFCKIIGYTEKEARRLSVRDVTHPEDYDAEAELTRRLIKGEIPGFTIEKRYVRKNGQLVWGQMTTTLVHPTMGGEPIYALAMVEDITERKQAEDALRESVEALRASEGRYRALADLSPDTILVNAGGRLVYANAAAARLFGADDPSEIIGLSPFDLLEPEYHARVRERIHLALEEGRTAPLMEYRWKRLDGSTVDVEVTSGSIFWQGAPAVQVVARDITEQKRAQNALRENEQLLRHLTRNIPGGSLNVFDPDFRYLFAAGLGLEQVGLSPEQLVGKTLSDIFPPEAVHYVTPFYRRAFAGESLDFELEVAGRWYLIHTAPLLDAKGTTSAIIALAQDITERKHAEHALQASIDALRVSEEKYRTLIESIDEGFCIIDVLYDENVQLPVDHRIIEANPAFEKHTGLKNPEGKLASELMPGVEQFWNDIYAGVVATGEAAQFEQHSPAFGRWFEVEALRIGSEPLRRVAVVFRDVTERKAAEEVLRTALEAVAQANEELEQRVAERTQALSERTEQVQELLRQLVSVQEAERARISRELHDQLGQHLTGFMLGMETLRTAQLPGSDSALLAERLRQAAADLSGEAHRLAWNLRPPALDDMGLEAALSSYVQEWQSLHKGIEVDFHSQGEDKEQQRLPPEVETTFYRIVQEALTNIARHAGEGASSVSIVFDRQQKHQARLTIEDDGAGFDATTVLASTSRLGLRGMQERAALLGGTLEVESTPGAGTTLFIRVPLLASQPAEEGRMVNTVVSDKERPDDD